MFTKIDLCSMALLKLGEKPIQSFADDSAAAQLARTLFDPITDSLIASHPWRFATQVFELAKTDDGDFVIPSNVLRIIKCPGQMQNGRISAPQDTIKIVALTRVAPESYPSYFVSLLATKLAMDFCVPMTGDHNVFRMLAALYETEYASAKFIDSTTTTSANIEDFSLVNTRF
ncbi:MAG: hypothetical protein J5679_02735 [Alphaproteobacteria bacterium]|nr:hypothetical protein [Alphaproteobacteria bacterium]